jgi:hypothetical protein
MATTKKKVVPNQVFVGLPWKTVRQRYERIIPKLEKKYPLHFTIVGRSDSQDAKALFEVIKERITSSSYALFDATGGNANVSLEYGYAEGMNVPRAIFLSSHKAAQRISAADPIISDLTGMRRVQYKTVAKLEAELRKLCRDHDYTKRFEKALGNILKNKPKGPKKRGRALALKLVKALGGKTQMRRADLVQHLQVQGYLENEIDAMLRGLHSEGVLRCAVGRYSDVHIA